MFSPIRWSHSRGCLWLIMFNDRQEHQLRSIMVSSGDLPSWTTYGAEPCGWWPADRPCHQDVVLRVVTAFIRSTHSPTRFPWNQGARCVALWLWVYQTMGRFHQGYRGAIWHCFLSAPSTLMVFWTKTTSTSILTSSLTSLLTSASG